MKLLNSELVVHRNETFTIDRTIQNKDGSPYIVSNRLKNPYILIAVSSTRYDRADRYLYNNWVELKDWLRFTSTQAVNLRDFTDNSGDTTPKYTKWSDITKETEISIGGQSGKFVAYGYIEGSQIGYERGDAVFYLENNNGTREYKYWTDTGWTDYTCRIVVPIKKEITAEWIEQSYVYSIQLVDGIKTEDALRRIYEKCVGKSIISTEPARFYYNLLLHNFPDELSKYKITKEMVNRPILNYDTVMQILIPTKLTVLSNIEGEM